VEAKKQRFSPPAIGGTSLLVVFAVLCLTVFALLSLTTVQADVRLAEASARAVSDYYAADVNAQEILALLRSGGPLPEDLEIEVSIAHYPDRGEHTYSYACPISDTQELQVEVLVDPADGSYSVLRWQAVPVGGWEESGVEIWDGEIF